MKAVDGGGRTFPEPQRIRATYLVLREDIAFLNAIMNQIRMPQSRVLTAALMALRKDMQEKLGTDNLSDISENKLHEFMVSYFESQ